MSGASAEGEVNHWPAFVDVLTTVIMVVTFLLVIMSAAVMVLSQRAMENFKKQLIAQEKIGKLEEDGKGSSGKSGDKLSKASAIADGKAPNRVLSPTDAEAGSTVAELGSVVKADTIDGAEKLSIRTRETPDTLKLKVKSIEEAQDTKGAEVKAADLLMRVEFEPTAVRYSGDNEKQMLDFLKSRAQPNMKYEIWSFAPQENGLSEAQRIAFYRAAMTRNILIKAGIAPAMITTQIRITDPMSKDGHNVRVVLKP